MRDLSTILGQIRTRAEYIVKRGSEIRYDPELRANQILCSADDADAILRFVEEAQKMVLDAQLKASLYRCIFCGESALKNNPVCESCSDREGVS